MYDVPRRVIPVEDYVCSIFILKSEINIKIYYQKGVRNICWILKKLETKDKKPLRKLLKLRQLDGVAKKTKHKVCDNENKFELVSRQKKRG